MKVRLTPRALREAKRRKTWWLANRPEAPRLFDRELAAAVALLGRSRNAGVVYPTEDAGEPILRILLRRTGTHVYYVIDAHGAPAAASANRIPDERSLMRESPLTRHRS